MTKPRKQLDHARRYRKAYGTGKARAHAVKKQPHDPAASVIKLKDRYSGGYVWLTMRDGNVVGVMGSDPKRYLGMALDRAKHVARYGGTGSRTHHATAQVAPTSVVVQIGDIVQRSDVNGKNRYLVVNIHAPWIYTRRISGSGGPGVITFPSALMLRKVG